METTNRHRLRRVPVRRIPRQLRITQQLRFGRIGNRYRDRHIIRRRVIVPGLRRETYRERRGDSILIGVIACF